MNIQPENPLKLTQAIIASSMIALMLILLYMASSCSTMKKASSETNEYAFAKAAIATSENEHEKKWDFGEVNQESLTTGFEPLDSSKPMIIVDGKGDTTQIHNGKKTETKTKSKEFKNSGESNNRNADTTGAFDTFQSTENIETTKERTGIPLIVSLFIGAGVFLLIVVLFVAWYFKKTLTNLIPKSL